jgi:hypothetical protein
MRRALIGLLAVLAFTTATAIPVAAIGETLVTLTCDDGTTTSLVADADTLAALTTAVQGMIDYPAGLSCTLAQQIVHVPFGGVALAANDSRFIVGGGRWRAPCALFPGGGGAAAAAPTTNDSAWVNVAVNVHDKGDGSFVGTLNETIPSGQVCNGLEVGQSHFTSKPDPGCVLIDSTDGAPGHNQNYPRFAYTMTHVTETSGLPFPQAAPDSEISFAFEDTGNPGHQLQQDRLNGPPAFDDSTCATGGTFLSRLTPEGGYPLENGNISVHP